MHALYNALAPNFKTLSVGIHGTNTMVVISVDETEITELRADGRIRARTSSVPGLFRCTSESLDKIQLTVELRVEDGRWCVALISLLLKPTKRLDCLSRLQELCIHMVDYVYIRKCVSTYIHG